MAEDYQHVDFLEALARYGQKLKELDDVYDSLKGLLGFDDLYIPRVEVELEGIVIGEFRNWDDTWWWHPKGVEDGPTGRSDLPA